MIKIYMGVHPVDATRDAYLEIKNDNTTLATFNQENDDIDFSVLVGHAGSQFELFISGESKGNYFLLAVTPIGETGKYMIEYYKVQ